MRPRFNVLSDYYGSELAAAVSRGEFISMVVGTRRDHVFEAFDMRWLLGHRELKATWAEFSRVDNFGSAIGSGFGRYV